MIQTAVEKLLANIVRYAYYYSIKVRTIRSVRKMIHIGKPYIAEEGDRAYLKASVTVSPETAHAYTQNILPKRKFCVWLTDEDYPPEAWDKDGTLWFDVPSQYSRYLCKERSNAFVVALFWYAVVSGSDIEFETPLSKRLYDGLTAMLLPALNKSGFPEIRFVGPTTEEPVWCEGAVVAGMSGGVDSNYTLMRYSGKNVPEDLRLTHLCHYTCGNLFKPAEIAKGKDALYRQEDGIQGILLDRAQKIAEAHHISLIDTNTNLDIDYYRGGYIYMAMYRYLSCTLAVEHLYKTYISSSSGHETDATDEVSLFVPTQHYEGLLCRSLRTETFKYISSDHDSRITKLKALSDDKVFQKTVSVCFQTGKNGENCGECYGCMKTMIPLDVMGKLDGFRESFDLECYYSNRERIYRSLIDYSKRPEASSARQTVRQLLELSEEEHSPGAKLFQSVYISP